MSSLRSRLPDSRDETWAWTAESFQLQWLEALVEKPQQNFLDAQNNPTKAKCIFPRPH